MKHLICPVSYTHLYKISSVGDAFNVNDELNITGTTMTIEAEEDAVKVNNDDDTSAGTMYLSDNTMTCLLYTSPPCYTRGCRHGKSSTA